MKASAGSQSWRFPDLDSALFWASCATAGLAAAVGGVVVERQRPDDATLDRITAAISDLIDVLVAAREHGDEDQQLLADSLLGAPEDIADTPDEATSLYALRALWDALGKEDGLGRETPQP